MNSSITPLKCDVCGRFISIKDLDEGRAINQMITPSSDYSSEQFDTRCKDHYVLEPPKRIIDEDVHPIRWVRSAINRTIKGIKNRKNNERS